MQTVFLLAGANKRFQPFNSSHKAMVYLYGKPILHHVIDSLRSHDLKEFIFVLTGNDTETKNYFGNGKLLDVSISYRSIESPQGQGAGLLKAADLLKDPFIVMNPYHIDYEGLTKKVLQLFTEKLADAVIPGVYEEHIEHYGSLDVENGIIKNIIEKPALGTEPSHFKATFGYVFKQDFLTYLKRQPETHYSYELAIAEYCKDHTVHMYEIPTLYDLPTLKYPWHLFKLREIIGKKVKGYISPSAKVAKTAIIDEHVFIDDGAVVCDYACIKGNTYIGKNTMIGNFSLVRDSDIESEVHLGVYSDVTRSIIMKGTHSHGSGFIGDSIIGENCRLAYGFVTANKRLDSGPIHRYSDNAKIPISDRFGAMIGNETHTGINVSVMPGVIIKAHSQIAAGEMVKKNLE